VPTAAAAPSAAQIKAGQNGSGGAATWSGSLAVSSTGAKSKLAYGLAVGTIYDTYVVHEGAADSNIPTAEFTTVASTIIVRHAEDGATTSLTANFGTFNTNAADSLGGTNAISYVDNNVGTVGSASIQAGALTYFNGVNRIRVRLKRISSSVANLWIRLNPSNLSAGGNLNTHLNLTARNNSGATQGWTTATVTDLDGVWIQFDGTIDMTGLADLVGNFGIALGDANNDTTLIRDGTQSIAVHDLIISRI
jgi:hypothetical protein